MAEAWTVRRERGSRLGLVLLIWIARQMGRRAARLILYPVVAYYMLAAPAARAASRNYLQRVLGRQPGWRQIYRHLYCFAAVALDRVYMFSPRESGLAVTPHGLEAFSAYRRRGEGAIIIVAHLGSFEILRALSGAHSGVKLRVLMDRRSGAKANAVLEAVNPRMRESIIDTSGSDIDLALKVKAALDRGEMVGLMADRYRPGDKTVDCDFLGGRAPLPISPWVLAGVTRAPVLLAFGLYRGGNRYDLYCEEFSQGLELPRARRRAQAHGYAQAYADRLADYAREAPYNWFNFYKFWHEDAPSNPGGTNSNGSERS